MMNMSCDLCGKTLLAEEDVRYVIYKKFQFDVRPDCHAAYLKDPLRRKVTAFRAQVSTN
ncbi:MAG: hypothetical protein V1809_15020 [Planctomycetota bacterium]